MTRGPLPDSSRPRAGEIARLAVLALFFLAAPTAGDIGSCGQTPADLDATKFFQAKEAIDCAKCDECGILSRACDRACDVAPSQAAFPLGCYPLVHDGEVCLNALNAAGCGEYQAYVSDLGPTTPTECNFCPISADAGSPDAQSSGVEPPGAPK